MINDILDKYTGYYLGLDLEGNSIPVKSWTFETENQFNAALDKGLIIDDGSLIWITNNNAYYKVIDGKL